MAVTDTGTWSTWSPAERESFFQAIARHRRASWRVTLTSLLCDALVAIVVAILMAPPVLWLHRAGDPAADDGVAIHGPDHVIQRTALCHRPRAPALAITRLGLPCPA